MTAILYSGTGPGLAQDHMFVWSRGDSAPQPVRLVNAPGWRDPWLGRDGSEILAIGQSRDENWMIRVDLSASEPYGTPSGRRGRDALLQPARAPVREGAITVVRTPGYSWPPPSRARGHLMVLDDAGEARKETVAALTGYCWGADDTTLLLSDPRGQLMRWQHEAMASRAISLLAKRGRAPVMAPTGIGLAYFDGQHVQVTGLERRIEHDPHAPVIAMAWSEGADRLFIAVRVGMMTVEVRQLDLAEAREERLFQCGRIDAMVALDTIPDWMRKPVAPVIEED